MLLHDDYALNLPRAPEVRDACSAAYGPPAGAVVISLTELQEVIGAHRWHTKGVPVPALGARIHPHYGVFAPIRPEYVDLVARAPLEPSAGPGTAFNLGTGTGVLAAVLARRGFDDIVATDINLRALDCARDNVRRLHDAAKLGGARIRVVGPALYPGAKAEVLGQVRQGGDLLQTARAAEITSLWRLSAVDRAPGQPGQ